MAIEVEAFADTDRDRIARAIGLAARLHVGDRRQREPYLCHYPDLGIMPTPGRSYFSSDDLVVSAVSQESFHGSSPIRDRSRHARGLIVAETAATRTRLDGACLG